jgi:hypothetical protein
MIGLFFCHHAMRLQVKNAPFHFHHISNQKREPGKMSRPGKPLKKQNTIARLYSLDILPGGGYLRCSGE